MPSETLASFPFCRRGRPRALLIAPALAALALPAAAESYRLSSPTPGNSVHAIVVGIDNYAHPNIAPTLKGAVADAKDIAASLERAGVSDVRVLIDGQATRESLKAALAAAEAAAKAGDIVLFTYAGHGSQEPEAVPGSEPDGKDEFFVLWGFDAKGPGTRERILDDEMFSWLRGIAAKGAETIFLADSCFGGGMTKAPEAGNGPGVRALLRVDTPERATPGAYYIAPGDDQLPQFKGPRGDDATKDIKTLTFIGAVDDAHTTPEVAIEGEKTPRGAASYVLSRALQGMADKEGNRDGVTTRAELFSYLHRNIARLSQNRQIPATKPASVELSRAALFRAEASAATVPDTTAALKPDTAGPASQPAATVSWDQATGNAIDQSGAVLAYGIEKAALPAIEERVSALRELQSLAKGRALAASLAPAASAYKPGDKVKFNVTGLMGRYLILMNWAGDGTVQLLFPSGNAPNYMDKDELSLPMNVEAPFGTDTLVVVATSERRSGLEQELAALDQKKAGADLVDAIGKFLGSEDRIALATYATKPR